MKFKLLKATMNRHKGMKRDPQNLLQFKLLIRKISRNDLNMYNASGMTLLQKGRSKYDAP